MASVAFLTVAACRGGAATEPPPHVKGLDLAAPGDTPLVRTLPSTHFDVWWYDDGPNQPSPTYVPVRPPGTYGPQAPPYVWDTADFLEAAFTAYSAAGYRVMAASGAKIQVQIALLVDPPHGAPGGFCHVAAGGCTMTDGHAFSIYLTSDLDADYLRLGAAHELFHLTEYRGLSEEPMAQQSQLDNIGAHDGAWAIESSAHAMANEIGATRALRGFANPDMLFAKDMTNSQIAKRETYGAFPAFAFLKRRFGVDVPAEMWRPDASGKVGLRDLRTTAIQWLWAKLDGRLGPSHPYRVWGEFTVAYRHVQSASLIPGISDWWGPMVNLRTTNWLSGNPPTEQTPHEALDYIGGSKIYTMYSGYWGPAKGGGLTGSFEIAPVCVPADSASACAARVARLPVDTKLILRPRINVVTAGNGASEGVAAPSDDLKAAPTRAVVFRVPYVGGNGLPVGDGQYLGVIAGDREFAIPRWKLAANPYDTYVVVFVGHHNVTATDTAKLDVFFRPETRVVFTRARTLPSSTLEARLRIVNLDGTGEADLLPRDDYKRLCPQWSPDGTYIAYQRMTPDTTGRAIWAMRVGTGAEFPVAGLEGCFMGPTWISPTVLLTNTLAGEPFAGYRVADVEAGTVTVIEGETAPPNFVADICLEDALPDGSRLLCQRRRYQPSPTTFDVWTKVPLTTNSAFNLTGGDPVTIEHSSPRFTPDGQIAWRAYDSADASTSVWLMNRDGTNRRRVYAPPPGSVVPLNAFGTARDGQLLFPVAATSGDGNGNPIRRWRPDGTGGEIVSHPPADEWDGCPRGR